MVIGQYGREEAVVAIVSILGLHKELKKARGNLKSVFSREYIANALSTSNVCIFLVR